MKQFEIKHLDGNNETFIVEAETMGKAKFKNYIDWREAFGGTFGEYLQRLISCCIYRP